MIVNYSEKGWEVITQRAHGIVSAQLAFNWRVEDRPERWVETLLAIAEHDDAENELDGETLITEAGGPLNYAMKKFELPHCRKLASLTITKSQYVSLLISMHMEFLYGREKSVSAEAKKFLAEQQTLQTQWRKQLGIDKEEALRIYNLLEWCDALSLLICKGEMQPEERKTEISSGPDQIKYHVIQVDDQTLSIDPWPFQVTEFVVRYDSRLVTTIQFKSSAEFRKAFLDAEVEEKSWTITKSSKVKTPDKTHNKLKK